MFARCNQHLTAFEYEPDRNHTRRSVCAHSSDARQMAALAQKFGHFVIGKLWHALRLPRDVILAA